MPSRPFPLCLRMNMPYSPTGTDRGQLSAQISRLAQELIRIVTVQRVQAGRDRSVIPKSPVAKILHGSCSMSIHHPHPQS